MIFLTILAYGAVFGGALFATTLLLKHADRLPDPKDAILGLVARVYNFLLIRDLCPCALVINALYGHWYTRFIPDRVSGFIWQRAADLCCFLDDYTEARYRRASKGATRG